jgi:hypothetical protein
VEPAILVFYNRYFDSIEYYSTYVLLVHDIGAAPLENLTDFFIQGVILFCLLLSPLKQEVGDVLLLLALSTISFKKSFKFDRGPVYTIHKLTRPISMVCGVQMTHSTLC